MGLVPDARIDELVYGQLLTREAGVVPGSEEIAALVRGVDPLMSAAEVAVAVTRVRARMDGLGPLDVLLADASVTDILVNGSGPVWVERHGELSPTDVWLDRPVVVFSYLNPVLRYGVDEFLRDAAGLGVAGLLLTDLPVGSDPALEAKVRQSPLDLIRLVAPTTTGARLTEVVTGAEGFLYLVARLGVTGASRELATGLEADVARVRAATPLPLAIGFGISTAAQARAVAHLADGVVVGSALVECLGRDGPEAAGRLLGELRAALDQADRERPA